MSQGRIEVCYSPIAVLLPQVTFEILSSDEETVGIKQESKKDLAERLRAMMASATLFYTIQLPSWYTYIAFASTSVQECMIIA